MALFKSSKSFLIFVCLIYQLLKKMLSILKSPTPIDKWWIYQFLLIVLSNLALYILNLCYWGCTGLELLHIILVNNIIVANFQVIL